MENDYRAAFQEIAKAWKRTNLCLSLVIIPGALSWLMIEFWPAAHDVGVAGFIVCWAIIFLGSFAIGKLLCPACNKDTRSTPECYCPQCGARESIKSKGLFRSPKCEICEATLGRGKGGPRYTIKFCTHCGAHLSDEGV